ncbi:unnamed protein product, partial [Mesorhabditis spiculigera]
MQDNSRTMTERIGIHYLFEEIGITGLRHLKARNLSARSTWSGILVLFTALTLYQIYEQIDEFLGFPTVTNIEAEYPSEILFPAIAVCPNNQYRISYLASKEVLKRVPPDNRTIGANWAFFIKTINRMWDVPAEEFLREEKCLVVVATKKLTPQQLQLEITRTSGIYTRSNLTQCDVEMYFSCAQFIQKSMKSHAGILKTSCLPACESKEFITQQVGESQNILRF